MNIAKLKVVLLMVVLFLAAYFCTDRIGESNRAFLDTKRRLIAIGYCLQLYTYDFGKYPSTTDGLKKLTMPTDKKPYYIDRIEIDGWQNAFVYKNNVDLKSDYPFDLYSVGENGIDENGRGDDVNYWNFSEKERFTWFKR